MTCFCHGWGCYAVYMIQSVRLGRQLTDNKANGKGFQKFLAISGSPMRRGRDS